VKRSDARLEENAWLLANEFANVRLTIDQQGNDPRLCIEDLDTGISIQLDAFVLAGLTTLAEESFAECAQPERILQAALQAERSKIQD
jgi:hypothetical protein